MSSNWVLWASFSGVKLLSLDAFWTTWHIFVISSTWSLQETFPSHLFRARKEEDGKKISQCCFWPPDTENRILHTLCHLRYLYEQTRSTVHGPTDAFFLQYSKLVNEWRNNNKFRQDWWKTKIINKHTLTGDWIWNFFLSSTNVNMLSEIVNDEHFEVWIAHNDNAGWYLIVIVLSFIYTLPWLKAA